MLDQKSTAMHVGSNKNIVQLREMLKMSLLLSQSNTFLFT